MNNHNLFQQFRTQVYQNFKSCKRSDTLMDLLDALSSQTTAKSVVELSLSPHFRRHYTALNKAIGEECLDKNRLAQLASLTIPPPQERKFYLLGCDVTSNPRPYAPTLPDRSYVYQPNTIRGNKPVAIGHQYSVVALLPEREQAKQGKWVVPLTVKRVSSSADKELVGAEQIHDLLTDPTLPFGEVLCVNVGDSSYSKPAVLHKHGQEKNLVTVVRVRNNRTLYRQPVSEVGGQARKGHPTWYGPPFSLAKAETWGPPDETTETTYTSQNGKSYRVVVQSWHNLLMRGKKGCPMHTHPFTLSQIRWYDQEGKLVSAKPLWLIVLGDHRAELSSVNLAQVYPQRYNLEHFFRYGKQKLLLNKFQTPDDQHEEQWWRLSALAYLQLWGAHELATSLPRPWERYLPATVNKLLTPAATQRDMGRIIRQLGTPAAAPKQRGKSPGWKKGRDRPPRNRLAVVKKGKS